VISRDVSENMPNFHGKFTGPTDVVSRCCTNALSFCKLRNLPNSTFEISEQRIFTTLYKYEVETQDSQASLFGSGNRGF